MGQYFLTLVSHEASFLFILQVENRIREPGKHDMSCTRLVTLLQERACCYHTRVFDSANTSK